ncbi:MAG: hypothetical protein M3P50_06295 [Actinomycetota bacterium]|nr:hypothetical protein [Actinomycetota bacterium]
MAGTRAAGGTIGWAVPAASRSAAVDLLRLSPLLLGYLVFCAVAQPGPFPVRDEFDLLAAAHRILDGTLTDPETRNPRAFLWHGPGLPALLAPLVALGVPLEGIRFTGPILLGVATLLFHRLLRRRLAPRPALAWTYAFGLYAPFYAGLRAIHKEPLAVLLIVAAMLATASGLRTGRRRDLVGAGLALGGLALVRLEYGWVLVALLAAAAAGLLFARSRPTARRLVIVAATGVALCVPWLAHTWDLTGRPLYWSSSSGLSVYWMSPTGRGENGQWHGPFSVRRTPELAAYRPLFDRVGRLTPLEQDDEFRRLATENIRREPLLYLRNVAANTSRLFFFAPMNTPRSPVAIAGCAIFNGALLIGVAWALLAMRRRRSWPPEAAAFGLFAALGIGVHLLASAQPRMLTPLVPVLLWFAAADWHRRRETGLG